MPPSTPDMQTPPQPVKTLPTWVLIPIVIIFVIVFLLTGAWIFMPILIPLGIWYVRAYKKQQDALKLFASKYGLTYRTMVNLQDVDGVIFQNPVHIVGQSPGNSTGYLVPWLLQGSVANLGVRFYTYAYGEQSNVNNEAVLHIAGNRKNGTNFAVMDINVPGEGLQFLLISKTHETALNSIGVNLKRLQLEGDFNRYFDLYVPQGAEIEVLQIFTPDNMALLIDHYQQYSIELTPQHLFLYSDAGGITNTVNSLEQMLQDATSMAGKFFSAIEKVDFSKENIVTPALSTPTNKSRIAQAFSGWGVIIATIIIVAFGGAVTALISQDTKVPSGYTKATDAKVIKDERVPCNSSDSCSDSFEVRATFTATNGRAYWHEDSLISDHPIGSSIDLYYDPNNPEQAKFVGGNSTPYAIPIVIGFMGTFLVIIWGVYFAGRRT